MSRRTISLMLNLPLTYSVDQERLSCYGLFKKSSLLTSSRHFEQK